MAMHVTKKADIQAKWKREEAERRARRDAAETLRNDTPIAIAVDCFDALKLLSRVCLANVEFNAAIHVDVYDQLEILRVRLAEQGAEVEWREILPDYLKGEYGLEIKCE